MENVQNPEQYIPAVLERCKKQHVERTYEISGWNDATGFLEMLARKGGRLLKGGEADMDGVAKMVLNDFMRGRLPWFTNVPKLEGEEAEGVIEGRDGRLGEMVRKRKAEDVTKSDAGDEVGGEGEESEEEWGGIVDSDSEEGSGSDDEEEDDEESLSDSAPTLVAAESDDSEEEEEEEMVKEPLPKPKKRRRGN